MPIVCSVCYHSYRHKYGLGEQKVVKLTEIALEIEAKFEIITDLKCKGLKIVLKKYFFNYESIQAGRYPYKVFTLSVLQPSGPQYHSVVEFWCEISQ